MDEILKTMQLLNALMKGVPSGVYFSMIGAMVDGWARENNMPDAEVIKSYRRIMEVRERVTNEAGSGTA